MSALYASARAAFARAQIDWETAPVVVTLVGKDYAPDYLADLTFAAIPPIARIVSFIPLTGRVVSAAGILQADNPMWRSLSVTSPIGGVLLAQAPADTEEIDYPLLAYLDQGFGFFSGPVAEDTVVLWSSSFGGVLVL